MFYVNNNPILASEYEVLETLRNQLAEMGINKLKDIKVGTDNIQFTCPIHSGGQERKPSCGVSITNDSRLSGTVHCFTCNYTTSLSQMISHCFNIDDLGQFGQDWLIKNFLTVQVENRKDIKLDISRHQEKVQEKKYIEEVELEKYRYYHPYMYKRKLTNEIIEKYDLGYDNNFNNLKCITFPIRDTSGNVLFIARRSINSKIFNYPHGVEKPLYGLYELDKTSAEVIICEGLLDALTCNVYGKQALSMLGLGTRLQYEQLKKLKCRKLIAAFDADEAGYKATGRLRKAMRGHKIVVTYNIPAGKDINDLTQAEFNNLKEIL